MTDKILPDLLVNHGGIYIYNMQNSQKTYSVCIDLYLDHVVPDCQIVIRVHRMRDLKKQNTHSVKLICIVVFLKRGNTSLQRNQTKLNFEMSQRQTQLAGHKHGIKTMLAI